MTGKILYLYETATGLGHQRRASGIVNALIQKGYDVSVASGSFVEAEHYFDARAHLIRLPENRKKVVIGETQAYGFYDHNNQLVIDPDYNAESWNQQRVEALRPYLEKNKVDALMAEWWPFKRTSQFDKIVNALLDIQSRNFSSRPLILSSIRDNLESFEATSPEKADREDEKAVQKINRMVDAVLVHGDPALIRLEDTFSRHADIKKPVIYTGYVVNEGAKQTHQTRERNVIVSCGSGDSGHHILKAAFEARPHTGLNDHKWIYVLGPRMRPEEQSDFLQLAQTFNNASGALVQEIHSQMPDLPFQLSHAGLSLSYAGYNTTLEVASSRVPSVLVPKIKGDKFDQEQWGRLQRLQKKRMATIAHPDILQYPKELACLLNDAHAKGSPDITLDTDGAANTAEEVNKLLKFSTGSSKKGPALLVA